MESTYNAWIAQQRTARTLTSLGGLFRCLATDEVRLEGHAFLPEDMAMPFQQLLALGDPWTLFAVDSENNFFFVNWRQRDFVYFANDVAGARRIAPVSSRWEKVGAIDEDNYLKLWDVHTAEARGDALGGFAQ